MPQSYRDAIFRRARMPCGHLGDVSEADRNLASKASDDSLARWSGTMMALERTRGRLSTSGWLLRAARLSAPCLSALVCPPRVVSNGVGRLLGAGCREMLKGRREGTVLSPRPNVCTYPPFPLSQMRIISRVASLSLPMSLCSQHSQQRKQKQRANSLGGKRG